MGKSYLKKLESVGGQNPIEAAKYDCKIYHGPYIYNFDERQIVNYDAGWNLVGYSTTFNPNTIRDVLTELISANNLLFVTQYKEGFTLFDPSVADDFNTLTTFTDGLGYWVKVINAATIIQYGSKISDTFTIDLNDGDMYIMSEKAVGYDWMCRSKYTLRHSAGSDKFTKVTK